MRASDELKGEERRKFVRWHADVLADFIVFSDMIIPDVPMRAQGIVCDLSELGLQAVTKGIDSAQKEGLLAGAVKIGIIMQLPKSKNPVKIIGRVVWIKDRPIESGEKAIGVEFSTITNSTRDLLKEYIIDFYVK